MLPDRVSSPGPPTYESGVLPIALRGPAHLEETKSLANVLNCQNRLGHLALRYIDKL